MASKVIATAWLPVILANLSSVLLTWNTIHCIKTSHEMDNTNYIWKHYNLPCLLIIAWMNHTRTSYNIYSIFVIIFVHADTCTLIHRVVVIRSPGKHMV